MLIGAEFLGMEPSVAFPTKSDEVFFNIIAQLAGRCNVVNF